MIEIDIYTDGACEPNPGLGGWSYVIYLNGREIHHSYGGEMRTTNNRMEMIAIINALKTSKTLKSAAHARGDDVQINIFSDSDLCVKTLNSWAAGWQKKGWTRKGGAEIKNLDLVQEGYALFQEKVATLIWVKGHAGILGNERADELAEMGRASVLNSRIAA